MQSRSRRDRCRLARIATMLLLCTASAHASASERVRHGFSLGLETGAVWFARNDARIPGDTGTGFDVTALTGSDALPFARVSGHWRIYDRHSVRLVYAPLEVSDTGQLAQDTVFEGQTFRAGPAEGTYRFNAWKLTYRYALTDRGPWSWGVGFTGVVRDAEIGLRQGMTSASNDNVGFVPALHVSGTYRFDDRWALGLDVDGLAGGPGRLFDIAVTLERDLGRRWQIGAGYRTLEGGADTDDVYSFAWLNYAVLDIRYRF